MQQQRSTSSVMVLGIWAAAVVSVVAIGALVYAGVMGARAGLAAQAALGAIALVSAWRACRRDAAEIARLRGGLAEAGLRLESQVREVAKKSRNLEALIAAMDEPLLATGQDERVLLCNRSAEAVLGVGGGGGGGEKSGSSGTTLVGRRIDEVLTSAEALEMHAAAKDGRVRRARVPLVTPLGRRIFQVSAAPVPVAWGQGVFGAVVVLRDVTELDQAVQVKTELVANASHELRTPVAAIRAAAETLGPAIDEDPAMARRAAGMIAAHAGRLEELLRDLLDLSRLESPDAIVSIEAVGLRDLERGLAGLFEEVCRVRGLRLVFEFDEVLAALEAGDGGEAAIRTDRKLLMLILRNLIENATKFAFEGTEVRVRACLLAHDVESGRGGGRDGVRGGVGGGGVVRWEVIDRGTGIPLNQQERVFERFYQVDGARTGTGASSARGSGLGLAIVKHAARTLGGRVGLASVWGQGTTVWAEVPVGMSG